jgi:HD-GYP domain-containing protein (c-di-GMP phosphodiesterase class II)
MEEKVTSEKAMSEKTMSEEAVSEKEITEKAMTDGEYVCNSDGFLDRLYMEMMLYFSGDPKRIQHFVKVHSFARLIGHMEDLPDKQMRILEAAAYVHDIGIKVAESMYGTSNGKLQEELGPEQAEKILKKCGFERQEIERICYLVGHHHTYTDIDGMDYRILVEADFLVNLYEEEETVESVKAAYQSVFRTNSGRKLCRIMFGLEKMDTECK